MSLTLSGVSFRYGQHQPLILDDLSVEFDSGEVTAVVGPSGCGKSTLLYIAGLMLKPDSGDVTIDGQSTRHLNDRRRSAVRASHIGFIFQDAMLNGNRSVIENVMEGSLFASVSRSNAADRAHDLLERFGVADRSEARAVHLSGGQAQRVGICRALIKAPSVILADEPTGNLDGANADFIADVLATVARDDGSAVVIVTHDEGLAERCDRTVRLSAQ